jgi:alpha-methylacyl-CoA racemase
MSVLDGVRVLELAGIGPGPHAAMLLGDLGADVVRIDRPTPTTQMIDPAEDFLLRNRRSLVADLRDPVALDEVLALVDRTDVLMEGYRPGVAERLGIGPDSCLERNPRLIYGRMTGWGQDGPLAQTAGHDINYIALTGALSLIGRRGERPAAPLNLAGDFGGGSLYLVIGILAALFERERSGRGQIIDAAMVDGASSLIAMYWALAERGAWSPARGTNATDGGSPFYDTYRCADGRYVAVGAVEPKFYALLISGLGLDAADLPDQMDREQWPLVRETFAEIFATRDRDVWGSVFAGTDACVTPVLEMSEAAEDLHIRARDTIVRAHGQNQPAPAPRFSRSPPPVPVAPSVPGADREAVLRDWGVADRIRDAVGG